MATTDLADLKILHTQEHNYNITGKVGHSGMQATSFYATQISTNVPVFIKVVNLGEHAQAAGINKRLERLRLKFSEEIRHKPRLENVPGIAHVIDHGTIPLRVQDQEFQIPFLVQEYIDGISFNNYLNNSYAESGQFRGIRSAVEWLLLAKKMINIVADIHAKEVVHGDIWQDNFLMKGNQPILVDFGQSFIRDERLYTDEHAYNYNEYVAPERQKDSERPWEIPADIFALGVTLFYCATGERIDVNRKNFKNFELRDYIKRKLDNSSHYILKENRCVLHIILQCLLHEPHDRPSAFDLLRLTDITIRAQTSHSPAFQNDLVLRRRSLKELLRRGSVPLPPLLNNIFDYTLGTFLNRTEQVIMFKRLEISGDRNETINLLMEFISILGVNDYYWTVTTPEFWSPSNLGTQGRFFDLNFVLCQKGVSIKRVFLITRDATAPLDTQLRRLLAAHRNAMQDLEALGVNVKAKEIGENGCYTGVVVCSDLNEKRTLVKDGYIIGLSKAGDSYYALSFKSEGGGRLVRRLCIDMPNAVKVREQNNKLKSLLHRSVNLLDYEIE